MLMPLESVQSIITSRLLIMRLPEEEYTALSMLACAALHAITVSFGRAGHLPLRKHEHAGV